MSEKMKRTIIAGLFTVIVAIIGGLFLVISALIEGGFVITGPGVQVGNPQSVATNPLPTSEAVMRPSANLCYGKCWRYDENNRTMTWTGPIDGTEDIWQGDDISLTRIRNGWTAVFGPLSVPGEIEACILTLNGQTVINSCEGVQYPYQVQANNLYQATSTHSDVGGFRWKPAKGYGYRLP